MVAFSQEAQSHLERYLRQIKTALRGHPSIDADEEDPEAAAPGVVVAAAPPEEAAVVEELPSDEGVDDALSLVSPVSRVSLAGGSSLIRLM